MTSADYSVVRSAEREREWEIQNHLLARYITLHTYLASTTFKMHKLWTYPRRLVVEAVQSHIDTVECKSNRVNNFYALFLSPFF